MHHARASICRSYATLHSGKAGAIGIDMGTTKSVIAHLQDSIPVVLSKSGSYTPSVVAFTANGKRYEFKHYKYISPNII